MWRQVQKLHFSTHQSYDSMKWRKNKVAMVIGFIGSKYKGIQFNRVPEIKTIERELESVLHQVGCISKDNHQLIHKINWSRSSRTDKGVHAARLVISAKLLIPPNYPEGIKDLLSLINQKLPEDIRLFSITKVNQGFCARKSCNWREYEYHLPLDSLMHESLGNQNSQRQTLEMIDKLNAALKLMEGSQGMHNFHRAKRTRFTRDSWKWIPTQQLSDRASPEQEEEERLDLEDSESSETEIEEIEESHDLKQDLPRSSRQERGEYATHYYRDWSSEISPEELRIREKKGYNSILYLGEASLISVPLPSKASSIAKTEKTEKDVILFRFRGQAFLLHQIRIMVSAAVMYATNVIPLFAIEFALRTPYLVHFPLAPACGLLLVSSGYSRNTSKQDYALSLNFSEDGDKFLMTPEEHDSSYQFQSQQIYAQLYADWQNDSLNEIEKWFQSWEYHRLPEETLGLWKTLYASQLLKVKEIEENQHIISDARVVKTRVIFNEYLKLKSEHAKGSSQLKIFTKTLLPNGLQAALIVRYRLSPSGFLFALSQLTEFPSLVLLLCALGKVVLSVIRSLAYAVARGDAPIFITPEEVIRYLEKTGGVDHWKNEKQISWII